MVSTNDKTLMQQALECAWAYQGLSFPNPAVGAIISDAQGNIIGKGAHHAAGLPHAEVEALKDAYLKLSGDLAILECHTSEALHNFLQKNHRNLFHNLTLHVSLEPCHHYGKTPPCSQLIAALGIKRVVIGSADKSERAKGGGAYLAQKGIEVVWGCLEEESDRLLSPFIAWQAQIPFVFFKLAISRNGVVEGGTISCEASRERVHELRNVCDLLVIGGNTVRIDRPILDARMCNGKAPDILIYSRSKTFDRSIPLFNVPNRKIWIEDSLDRIKDYRHVMIEGGQGMLDAVKSWVTWYLLFQSPHEKQGSAILLPPLRNVFSMPMGDDTMSWCQSI